MPTKPSVEQSEITIRRFVEETINPGNIAAFDQLYDPHFVNHDPVPDTSTGVEGLKQQYRRLRAAFPDYRETIDSVIVRGDTMVIRTTMCGTHRGQWKGITPTGKHVTAVRIRILRMVDGKITERWGSVEPLGLMQQLGAIPTASGSESTQHRPNRTAANARYF